MEGIYKKNFKKWSLRKEIIDQRSQTTICRERDIWWCSLGCNIGSEEDGKHENFERPVLIFRKFGDTVFWGIPLSTRMINGNSNFEYSLTANGISQVADLPQLRLMSNKRLLRYVGVVSYDDFQAIRKLAYSLI